MYFSTVYASFATEQRAAFVVVIFVPERMRRYAAPRYMATEERRRPWGSSLEGTCHCKVVHSCEFTISSARSACSTSVIHTQVPMTDGDLEDVEGPVCLICLDEFTVPDATVLLMTCSHLYHKSCIMDWLQHGDERMSVVV
jgi:hypothetical protein